MENLTCVENNAYKQNRSTVAKLALEKLGLN